MLEEIVFIHKVDPDKYPYGEELFAINSSNHVHQSYAGVYDILTVFKILRGYNPAKISMNCANFHAKEIIKFIANLKGLKYNVSVGRILFRNVTGQVRIIILNFRKSQTFNSEE